MRLILLVVFSLFLSCAYRTCPEPGALLERVFTPPPKEFVLYGYAKVHFLRTPFLLERRDGEEKIQVGREGVFLSSRFLCIDMTCFELPVTPASIIYGYFPGNYRVKRCVAGEVILASDDREVVVEGGRLKEVRFGDLKILYGERAPEGYYRSLTVVLGELKLKLYIEGMRWEKEGSDL